MQHLRTAMTSKALPGADRHLILHQGDEATSCGPSSPRRTYFDLQEVSETQP